MFPNIWCCLWYWRQYVAIIRTIANENFILHDSEWSPIKTFQDGSHYHILCKCMKPCNLSWCSSWNRVPMPAHSVCNSYGFPPNGSDFFCYHETMYSGRKGRAEESWTSHLLGIGPCSHQQWELCVLKGSLLVCCRSPLKSFCRNAPVILTHTHRGWGAPLLVNMANPSSYSLQLKAWIAVIKNLIFIQEIFATNGTIIYWFGRPAGYFCMWTQSLCFYSVCWIETAVHSHPLHFLLKSVLHVHHESLCGWFPQKNMLYYQEHEYATVHNATERGSQN